ncbi:uncharacterized protein PS065_016917 [Dugong dugon]
MLSEVDGSSVGEEDRFLSLNITIFTRPFILLQQECIKGPLQGELFRLKSPTLLLYPWTTSTTNTVSCSYYGNHYGGRGYGCCGYRGLGCGYGGLGYGYGGLGCAYGSCYGCGYHGLGCGYGCGFRGLGCGCGSGSGYGSGIGYYY